MYAYLIWLSQKGQNMPEPAYRPRTKFITDHDSSNFYPAGICTIPTICYPRVQKKLFLYTREFHTMVAITTFLMPEMVHVSYFSCIFSGKQLILTTTSMCKWICIPVFWSIMPNDLCKELSMVFFNPAPWFSVKS